MKYFSIILLNSLLISLTFVEGKRECIKRQGKTTTYCVCNTTYCDDLDPIVKQDRGLVLVFETNQNGDRFKETKLKFSKNSNNSSIILTLNKSKTYQKIIGFGGAFTDASGLNLNTLPKDLAQNVMKDYYSANGIEYNMGRVPIGGCDFSTHPYAYGVQKDDFDLKSFKLEKEDFDYKIPYLKYAKKFGSRNVKLFGSPWSSPAWMKTNDQINHGGKLIGKPGEKYYKTWANYFVKFLDSYKANGIEFWGMTVENEPTTGFNPNYGFNCLGLNGEMERDFVKKDLGPALAKAGYGKDKLNLMVYDDGRNHPMVEWVDTCFNDNETAKYIHGIAYHCYDNGMTSWDTLDKVHSRHPNQFLMSTECCQEFKILPKNTLMRLGFWPNSEEYAKDIMFNLQHWVSGWVEWNFALDMYGQPNWAHFSSEAPILLNSTAKEYYKDPKFYVLGQFTKFLAPDSQRISLTSDTTKNGFNFVAFVRPDNSTVIIAYNLNNNALDFVINDPLNGKLNARIAAHSVQTYIYWN